MRVILLLFVVLSLSRLSAGQTPLDQYIAEGLERSPMLSALSYDVELARERFRESKRSYLPSATMNLRYTRSGGGRVIEFPVGDLLNPVYGALNGLTGTGVFPQIENESFRLLRDREQESKLSVVQPLYLPTSRHASEALASRADASRFEYDRTRRDLIASIQDAYLRYHQALDRVVILKDAIAHVEEAERSVERLVANGLATNDELFRLKAERSRVEQEHARAETVVRLSAAAFNTLLSRPPDSPVETTDVAVLERTFQPRSPLSLSQLEPGLSGREEMAQLRASIASSLSATKLARSTYLPNLLLVGDAGIQGERYDFNDEAFFRTASVVLSWTLFDGQRRASRVEQSKLARIGLESRQEALSEQLALELRKAVWEAELTENNIAVAKRGLESARSAFRLTSRRFEEGMATLLEVLDARATLTAARQQLNIAQFETMRAWVELRRVSPDLEQ